MFIMNLLNLINCKLWELIMCYMYSVSQIKLVTTLTSELVIKLKIARTRRFVFQGGTVSPNI